MEKNDLISANYDKLIEEEEQNKFNQQTREIKNQVDELNRQ